MDGVVYCFVDLFLEICMCGLTNLFIDGVLACVFVFACVCACMFLLIFLSSPCNLIWYDQCFFWVFFSDFFLFGFL